MSEPVISFTVREMFTRIEGKLGSLEEKVVKLESGSALRLAEEAHQAARRAARRALWSAVASPVVAGGVAWLATRR